MIESENIQLENINLQNLDNFIDDFKKNMTEVLEYETNSLLQDMENLINVLKASKNNK
ncbi:MAG TPA: hypothetical protein PKI46_04020 [Bacteroidales bacterium]|nr:hypothetical protein [Bacteroidales bacterium]